MFLGRHPLSLMYGAFIHIFPEHVKKSSCPGKREVKGGIWELQVKEDEQLRFRKRKKHFVFSIPGAIKIAKTHLSSLTKEQQNCFIL